MFEESASPLSPGALTCEFPLAKHQALEKHQTLKGSNRPWKFKKTTSKYEVTNPEGGITPSLTIPAATPNPTPTNLMNLKEFKLKWALKKIVRKLHGLSIP